MIRTIELILGLDPLSQVDANAVPMWRLWGSVKGDAPYPGGAALSPPGK